MKFTFLLLFIGLFYILGLVEFIIRLVVFVITFGLIYVAQEDIIDGTFAWRFAENLSRLLPLL